MKAVSSFLPYVLPFVMGCPKPVASRAIVDAAIEFCEQTQLVQQTLDPVSVAAGDPRVDLYVDQYQVVAMPLKAWYCGQELDPASTEMVSTVQAYRQDVPTVELVKGDPRAYFQVEPNVLGLFPIPDKTVQNAITLFAALRPKRGVTKLVDVLFDNWVEVIAAGALKRLHGTPGQAYTDMSQAATRSLEFAAGVNKATIEATRGRVPGELRVAMRPFA